MNSFRLIQIGDIHYSKAKIAKFQDKKDLAFPDDLADKTSIGPYRQALREIAKARDSKKGVNGIIFCGDLSTFGNFDEYQGAIKNLKKTLALNEKSTWRNCIILAVPGNHDIDRSKINHASKDLKAKFKQLEQAWVENDCPFYKHKELKGKSIELKKESKVYLFPLNSCIGCGEKRCYPDPIKQKFHKILDDYAKDKGHKKSFKLLGEDLDTPAFFEEDINYICDEISDLSPKSVPLLISHHNLLPQTIPRFDMYTELLNSGFVRSRLGKCGRPIIYCHAHVHSDPIEKIIDIKNGSKPIITISAPEIVKGFNIIDIRFNKNGIPLGCIIELYRISEDGHTNTDFINIPFVQPQDSTLLMSSKSIEVVSAIPSGNHFRFNSLLPIIKKAIARISKPMIEKCLVEASWFGLLEINNIEQQSKHWHIEKVVP